MQKGKTEIKDLTTLISKFKSGDQVAYKILYENYWTKVYGFASLYVKNKDDIQDVIQDIFIRIWENRDKIEENHNFEGYLFITTRNYIFNKNRDKIDQNFIDITYLNIADQLQNTEDEIVANNLETHLKLLIENMPPPQRREIFKLSRHKYKSYNEIAQILNISEKTVEYHISQALTYLKSKIRHQLP